VGIVVRVALASAALLIAGTLAAPVAAHARPTEVQAGARLAGVMPVAHPITVTDAQPAAARPCSAGLVALTFDDGPARGLTPKLVKILQDRRVPATFFMVGSRVQTAPRAARVVGRAGFTIGNHTWSHAHLTRLSDRAVRSEIRRTARELRVVGVRPSTLMRPPYGDINRRVRADIRGLDEVPVLWTVDSNDWRGGSKRQIAASILRQLRPHRTNLVLQHDGVRNSPASVAAVPAVVRVARHRGYCFAALGPHGRVLPPVPVVDGSVVAGSEAGPTPARVLVSLSSPTSRPVSVQVMGASGTAIAGEDFLAPVLRVSFPVGTTRAWVDVPVIDDTAYEPPENFHVLFDSPFGVVIARTDHVGTITSDDPGP
jgi:peptidoglycan/xylan/chitin deacetylase (PgdA/CDA1 family)